MISTEENFESMKRFVESKNYPWTVLHYGNQEEILKKYNVKVMPAYFFITPDGKLSLSPAPSPSEKIEWKIFQIMKKRGDI
jgi:L-2-hydroxyglutarate oxidase LhgO